MLHCRNQELLWVYPCGEVSAGGDLAAIQRAGQKHPQSPLHAPPRDAAPLPWLQREHIPKPRTVSECLSFPTGIEGDTGTPQR